MAAKGFFEQNITAIRRLVQGAFGLFTLFVGWQFYRFYLWAMGQGDYVGRPAAVEGFLPISALLSLKRLLATGHFDPIHPAGLVILMAALAIGLAARKGFCGWICPVGFAANLAQWLGTRLKIIRSVPPWLDYPLASLKYILLAFFLYIIVWKMDVAAISAFLQTPYNLAADAKMLQFFLAPSALALGILLFLLGISFVVANFWCRYLCPYGALLGLLAFCGPLQVKRRPARCIDCRQCDAKCPAGIKVSGKQTVRSADCIGCLECLAVCPQDECLAVVAPSRKRVATWLIPLATVAIFLGFWLVARLSDHWQSKVAPVTFRQMYQVSSDLKHPKY